MPAYVDAQEVVAPETIRLFGDSVPFVLESGESLAAVDVTFETYGTLNSDGANAILICHALTANAHAAGVHTPFDQTPGWWDGLIGPGKAFDTDRYFVVCPNILGSCYGTTGPVSTNPRTGRAYRTTFPFVTIRDIVRVQYELLRRLGVCRLAAVCGSSLGGMQVLEWAIMFPGMCETIIPISTAARQSAWCIALNAIARRAITSDPAWQNGDYTEQPAAGVSLARMVGMVSYRSPGELEERFGRSHQDAEGSEYDEGNLFQVESYLLHQGRKLVDRFDANTYMTLSHATDSHDVTRGRGTLTSVLGSVRARTLCIAVSTDHRYPPENQREIVRWIPSATFAEIRSIHGHDAFLLEFAQLNSTITGFLQTGREAVISRTTAV